MEENPIETLSNISIDALKYIKISAGCLTKKGGYLYQHSIFGKLAEYYKKTCKSLALQYISDPKSLTEDELERLIHESGRYEEILFESRLSLEDPIFVKIRKRIF
ncbi:hypothetical protein DSAG12_00608 [Promethearchaeum syntrophicum]|uniref:Uncharacterized protein n=1 Tax=Promethearchaeum syntrophicum TaxID=2594042 RepID=A0A5B9D741_9ARCH|nr:hypothetical protein [Candidatus Prometheoarchaeum syntrophicum]QEE14791.1 hypothetical protein DSAG12_00608 [Candidatus Prometheoarchaeum syntrophicum]